MSREPWIKRPKLSSTIKTGTLSPPPAPTRPSAIMYAPHNRQKIASTSVMTKHDNDIEHVVPNYESSAYVVRKNYIFL
jgi:hypothetical protein